MRQAEIETIMRQAEIATAERDANRRVYLQGFTDGVESVRRALTFMGMDTEADQKTEPRTTRSSSDAYFRHLLIAVLSRKGLAASILELPSLTQAPDVFTCFPANIKAFLMDVIELEKSDSRNWDSLETLLCRHGFEHSTLLDEAKRQCLLESNPREYPNARQHIREELTRIRQQESATDSVEQLERLVEQKLAKRRELDRKIGR